MSMNWVLGRFPLNNMHFSTVANEIGSSCETLQLSPNNPLYIKSHHTIMMKNRIMKAISQRKHK